jgi:hypothetical protein
MGTTQGTGSVRATVAVALGAALTTFLVVTVLVIEALSFEFSAIVALPIGLLAGVAVLVLVALTVPRSGRIGRGFAVGAAGFGYAVVVLLAVRYVDFAGLRSDLSTDLVVIVAATVAALAFVATAVARPRIAPGSAE